MRQVLKVYLRLVIALLPVVFLPLVVDAMGTGKNWIIVVLTAIGLLLWVVSLVINKDNAKIRWNRIMNWVLILMVWSTVSFILEKVGVRARSAESLFGFGTIISSGVLAFLWLQVSDEGEQQKQLKWLTVSGLLVAVLSLVSFLIPTSKLPINFPKDNPFISISQGWSLTGGLLSELWLMVVLAWFWVEKLWKKLKNKEQYLGAAIVSAVLTLIIFLDVFKIIKLGWGYLDLSSSWMIAVESLKQKPLMGIGIGNFLEAFYKWRPISYNSTANWAGVFGMSGSWLLQIWTELGLVGLVTMIFVWLSGWKKQSEMSEKIKAVVLGLLLLASPITILGWWLWLWIILGTENKNSKEGQVVLRVGGSGLNAGPALLLVIIIGGLVWSGSWWVKILMGEVYLRRSLVAAAKNDGVDTYNQQVKMVATNPNYAEYRRIYSQTNMVLAVNILSAKDLAEADKEKGVVLTQQAVREAKAAVALDEANPNYWSNLSVIYKQLIGSVDGAADWAAQAYYQAIQLDPMNPVLKLDFGGMLYSLGAYEDADRMFEQVVTLKQDFANGWYNWANSAKTLKKLNEAVSRLTQALTLVEPGTGDYDKAVKELADWKKELETLTKQQQEQIKQAETLKLPEAIPTQNKEVEVPKEGLEPPAVEPTPTPTE
jgi:tetratricopeptide (TPR) repeat protein